MVDEYSTRNLDKREEELVVSTARLATVEGGDGAAEASEGSTKRGAITAEACGGC